MQIDKSAFLDKFWGPNSNWQFKNHLHSEFFYNQFSNALFLVKKETNLFFNKTITLHYEAQSQWDEAEIIIFLAPIKVKRG